LSMIPDEPLQTALMDVKGLYVTAKLTQGRKILLKLLGMLSQRCRYKV
jgi:hypothetical protein